MKPGPLTILRDPVSEPLQFVDQLRVQAGDLEEQIRGEVPREGVPAGKRWVPRWPEWDEEPRTQRGGAHALVVHLEVEGGHLARALREADQGVRRRLLAPTKIQQLQPVERGALGLRQDLRHVPVTIIGHQGQQVLDLLRDERLPWSCQSSSAAVSAEFRGCHTLDAAANSVAAMPAISAGSQS